MESLTKEKPSARGRPFTKGNGGRKPGSRNRTTVIAAALVEGRSKEMTNKAIELALAGNPQMLKMFVGPTLPRERLVQIELPDLTDPDNDPVQTMARVIKAVAEGKISPGEGAAIASLLESYRRTLELTKVVQEIAELRAELEKVKLS